MSVRQEHTPEEVKRLERCLNDLVSVLALPAMWRGAQPSQIVHTLLDALLGVLYLDLVYPRFEDPAGGAPIEVLKIALSAKWLPDETQDCKPTVRRRSTEVAVATKRLDTRPSHFDRVPAM